LTSLICHGLLEDRESTGSVYLLTNPYNDRFALFVRRASRCVTAIQALLPSKF